MAGLMGNADVNNDGSSHPSLLTFGHVSSCRRLPLLVVPREIVLCCEHWVAGKTTLEEIYNYLQLCYTGTTVSCCSVDHIFLTLSASYSPCRRQWNSPTSLTLRRATGCAHASRQLLAVLIFIISVVKCNPGPREGAVKARVGKLLPCRVHI